MNEVIISSRAVCDYYELKDIDTNEWSKFHKGMWEQVFQGYEHLTAAK